MCIAVWDSSIVLSKYFERHPQLVEGKRCLDLSAGCGLVGLVLCKLGSDVVATDLKENLPLLQRNFNENGCPMNVQEFTWGECAVRLDPPFEIIAACDVMYIHEAIPNLVKSLVSLSNSNTSIYVSYGRNRQAEEDFLKACQGIFSVSMLSERELDEVYQCIDVTVLKLQRQM